MLLHMTINLGWAVRNLLLRFITSVVARIVRDFDLIFRPVLGWGRLSLWKNILDTWLLQRRLARIKCRWILVWVSVVTIGVVPGKPG